MPLTMARPWKHPDSGVYWFRKGVPAPLRALVGKREEKISPQTKDPVEARLRHGKMAADVAARWAKLQTAEADSVAPEASSPDSLSEREAHEIARVYHERYLESYTDDPSNGFWKPEIGETLWRKVDYDSKWRELTPKVSYYEQREAEKWCVQEAELFAAHLELRLDKGGIDILSRAIGAAVHSASLKLRLILQGNYGPSLAPVVQPETQSALGRSGTEKEVPFSKLFDGWRAEKGPSEKTAYSWKRVLDYLSAHLGHADAARLTPEDMIGWKNALIEGGRKGKTIRDGKLAPVRAILQWGVDNRLLKSNAAERVSVSVKSKVVEKIRGYTDEEAKLVLSAALRENSALKRWVPWICAYTGARVAEVCQLRAEDFGEREGIRFLTFAAEAGSLKNANSERALPIHSALVAGGLTSFVETVKSGPLFPDLKPDRFGSRGGNGTKVLSRWVRDQGLDDLRISPNHSWRHRFKTLGRRNGLASDIVDAITGHGRKTVADAYGEFELSALQREIEKIPSLQL